MPTKHSFYVIAFIMLCYISPLLAIVDSNTFTSTSFGYDVYELLTKRYIGGAPGFVGGTMAIVYGAYCTTRTEVMQAVVCIIAGSAALNAEKIINSLGYII